MSQMNKDLILSPIKMNIEEHDPKPITKQNKRNNKKAAKQR